MICQACNGTGDMPIEQIEEHYAGSSEPVCIRYGCQICQGLGEIEKDDDGDDSI